MAARRGWTSARLSKKQGALHAPQDTRNPPEAASRIPRRFPLVTDLSRYDDWLVWLREQADADPDLRVVFVGGSAVTGGYDDHSDLDVEVLATPGRGRGGVPPAARRRAPRLLGAPGVGAPGGDLAGRPSGLPEPPARCRRPQRADPHHRPPCLRPRRPPPVRRPTSARRAAGAPRPRRPGRAATRRRGGDGHARAEAVAQIAARRQTAAWLVNRATRPRPAGRGRRVPPAVRRQPARAAAADRALPRTPRLRAALPRHRPAAAGTPHGSRPCSPVPTSRERADAAFAWQDELLAELASA